MLLTLKNVSLAYGHHPLLAGVDFQIDAGERICLLGRNGTGKSTLLRVLSGEVEPDDGEVWRRDTLRVAHLEQEAAGDDPRSVYEAVAAGLGDVGQLLVRYHNAAERAGTAQSGSLAALAGLQQQIEVRGGWTLKQRVEMVLSRLSLPTEQRVCECSGGVLRRVMLARTLIREPDLLLLDEPTNHMDIAAITWLEEFLLNFRGALVFVTHDRTLLRHLATRVVELDRGQLTSFPGDFHQYLRRKERLLAAETRAHARLDKKLAAEEVWLRKGIRARRTRNEGRVRALEALRRDKAQRIARQGQVQLEMAGGELSGRLVVDVQQVDFAYGECQVIRGLSTRILRGERVGIIGPNGSGKSTLLRLLLGEIAPDKGRVVRGSRLEFAYFDQQRAQLDLRKSVRDNLADGGDYVTVKGRSRHVIGYLKSFLFPAERIDSPAGALSGGERNRLLLARLFTRPANVLVMDEPTNDLDVDTLELLEELLAEYEGTLLLVSHDRTFLDNVVSSVLAFEGDGRVEEYVGGYEDWLRQRPSTRQPTVGAAPAGQPDTAAQRSAERQRKLSFNEQRELAALPAELERLEQAQRELEQLVSRADFYRQDGETIRAALARLEGLRHDVEQAYARWEQLERIGR